MGPEKRLSDYIRQVRSEPFRWGHHDCLTFSNAAFKAYHGFGYAEDWLGRYLVAGKPMSKAKMQEQFDAATFDEAVGRKLQRVCHVPPRGALVATRKIKRFATGYALGICVGMKAAFLSRNGVIYMPVDKVDNAWVPK